jgi:heme-degrading monooxygenase HmoA
MGGLNNYEAIVPVHAGFRDLPPRQAFMWERGIVSADQDESCAVVFTSLRNLLAERSKIDRLLELDHAAHEEAKLAPGFRTYWHDDELSPEGLGKSFCLWQSQEHARAARSGPLHQEAVKYVRSPEGQDVYHFYKVQEFIIHVRESGLSFVEVDPAA